MNHHILSDLNIIAVILLDPLFVSLFLYHAATLCELSVDDDNKIARAVREILMC